VDRPEVPFAMNVRFRLVLLLAAASVAAGCARNVEVADASFGSGSRSTLAVAGGVGPAGAPPTPDRFVVLAGRKPGGFGFVQNTPDTWGPFDVSVHSGFFDPDLRETPAGVRVCLEISNVGFSVFYDVCATHDGSDWTVAAFKGAPLQVIAGSIELDADEIELRAEQTGGNVNFYARAFGSMTWTPVSTTSFAAQADPLKFSFGATGLSKGTAVGFDDAFYDSAGPPSAPAPAVAVAADVNAALLAGLTAHSALEGGVPDFVDAAASLSDAQDAVDDAQDGAAGLPPSKAVSSAIKLVGKAEKALAKAQDQVADQDAEKAIKTLEKGGDALVEAALLLNPQPFPAP
jgi:hypothetical protein